DRPGDDAGSGRVEADAALSVDRPIAYLAIADGGVPALQQDQRRVLADAAAGLVTLEDKTVNVQLRPAHGLSDRNRLHPHADLPPWAPRDPRGQLRMVASSEKDSPASRATREQALQQSRAIRTEFDTEAIGNKAGEPLQGGLSGR